MSTDPTPSPAPSNLPSGRSGAVTAVSIVNFVLGVLQLLCGGCVAFGGGMLAGMGGQIPQQPDVDPQAAEAMEQITQIGGGVIAILGAAYLLLGVLLLIAGYGVLKRQPWGRILTLVIGGIAAILAIVGMFSGEWVGSVTNLAYAVFVYVVLLNKQNAAEFA